MQDELRLAQQTLADTRVQFSQVAGALKEKSEHIEALRSQLEQSLQANERAFALHAAREAEWSQQAAKLHSELHNALESVSRAAADVAKRDSLIQALRGPGRRAGKAPDTPESAP